MHEFFVPPVVTIADDTNLVNSVWNNADQAPDFPVFARLVDDHWVNVTSACFKKDVIALAKGLLHSGIETGTRVAIMSKTRYEWTLIDYAIWACGAVTVPIYETSSVEQVTWILTNSGSVACFTETTHHHDLVMSVRDHTPDLRHLWLIDPDDSGRRAIDELMAMGADIPANMIDEIRHSRHADDIATIIYTSGTTGQPKGCVLTHRNIAADAYNVLPILHFMIREGESTLLFLPLAHSFARLIQVGAFHVRATIAHTSDIKNLADHLRTFRPTFLLAAPRVFEKVYYTAKQRSHDEGKGLIFDQAERVAIAYSQALDTPQGPGLSLRILHTVYDKLLYSRLRKAIGGRCHAAISGSAPLSQHLGHFFRGIGIVVYEGYGLTETSPAVSVNLDTAQRIGTVGRPLPGVAVRVNNDGEILVKGDIVFQRYWGNETAATDTIDRDGWFYTGDLGELDNEGYLTITGRKKEIIVTAAGKNVAPAVLEDPLRAHPLISQCMVIGDRMPFIALLVTLDDDMMASWKKAHGKPSDSSAEDLRHDPDLRAEIQKAIDAANTAVSRAESIREFRILPQDFSEATGELTPSMKVRRDIVLQRHTAEIASIYGN